MLILGIDTATAAASVALVRDAKVLCEESRSAAASGNGRPAGRTNHAETLLPQIDRVLRRSRVALADIGALAVAIGPGSFTGLRIGLSTAKGLAYGEEIPVVGVPTLEAVAARVNDYDGFVCPFLDARKKEVYAALFQRQGSTLERVSEDVVAPPAAVIENTRRYLNGGACLFIGDGVASYGDLIKAALAGRGRLTFGEGYASSAAAVARLAAEKVRRHEFDPVGPLAPIYLRASEAEIKKK